MTQTIYSAWSNVAEATTPEETAPAVGVVTQPAVVAHGGASNNPPSSYLYVTSAPGDYHFGTADAANLSAHIALGDYDGRGWRVLVDEYESVSVSLAGVAVSDYSTVMPTPTRTTVAASGTMTGTALTGLDGATFTLLHQIDNFVFSLTPGYKLVAYRLRIELAGPLGEWPATISPDWADYNGGSFVADEVVYN